MAHTILVVICPCRQPPRCPYSIWSSQATAQQFSLCARRRSWEDGDTPVLLSCWTRILVALDISSLGSACPSPASPRKWGSGPSPSRFHKSLCRFLAPLQGLAARHRLYAALSTLSLPLFRGSSLLQAWTPMQVCKSVCACVCKLRSLCFLPNHLCRDLFQFL